MTNEVCKLLIACRPGQQNSVRMLPNSRFTAAESQAKMLFSLIRHVKGDTYVGVDLGKQVWRSQERMGEIGREGDEPGIWEAVAPGNPRWVDDGTIAGADDVSKKCVQVADYSNLTRRERTGPLVAQGPGGSAPVRNQL
uniref:Uncharacterized protein n=1 Tax=Branchiostoma floridae TaxID=7739 RepID=C3XR50_BRAFL|eukprot:XP_002613159.1 hypothetical protein BRAFLDRAFT_73064 [Branchiostoma floridae]